MDISSILSRRACKNYTAGLLMVGVAGCLWLASVTARAEMPGKSYIEQIQNERMFGSTMEWVGAAQPSEAEFLALNSDVQLFKNGEDKAGFDGLEKFLQKYPQSGWAPALNVNLADYYRVHGRYTLALNHWEMAWNATKSSQDAQAQQIAVRAVAGWSRLLACLGEKEKLGTLFKELADLQLPLGIYGTEIEETKEGFGVMKARPGVAYRCGSYALGHMAAALHLNTGLCRKLYETDSPDNGFHMDELLALAKTNGMEVMAVRRPAGAELIVPCVVHWKLNHYAAILEQKDGRYLVEDPTFQEPVWMDVEAIDAESSGEFILPKDKTPDTWQKLTEAECAAIYGKDVGGQISDGNDGGPSDCGSSDNDDDDSDCDPPAANDGASNGGGPPPPPCPGCGMPQWSVSEPYMTLWLKDTPLFYRQSTGKIMRLTLSYKSRGEYLSYLVQNFGPDWSCNWLGMVQATALNTVTNYLAGGGIAGFKTDGTLEYKTARGLAYPGGICSGSGGAVISLQTPTKAQNIYGTSVYFGFSSPTNYYLTRRLDRYGRILQQMDYDLSSVPRVSDVVDMDGKTNTIASGNVGLALRITAVTNPYGMFANFKYNASAIALLTNITDAQGMSTYFQYDSNNQITNMVTPYGTNSFQYYSGTDANGYVERAILITETTGDHQLYVYKDDSPDSMPYTGDSLPNYRMSFHWNRKQYSAIGNDWLTYGFDMPQADYQKASIKHWLHTASSGPLGISDTLDSSADPYDSNLGTRPNCRVYHYYGESTPYIGTLKRVTSIAVNGQTILNNNLNNLGRMTNMVDFNSYGSSASYTNYFDSTGEILQREMGPRGELTRGYGYDPMVANLLTFVTNAVGDVVQYTHDPTTHKLTSTIFPGGMVRTNIYYVGGVNNGFLEMQADLGIRTNYFSYANGNLSLNTNELGLVTTYLYDNLNRLISKAYPDGTTESNIYSKLDIVATKDRLNQWTYYGYDSLGELIAVTNVNNQVTTYDYCSCGSPDQITHWNGSTAISTLYGYDIIGRLTSAAYQDGYQLSYSYDAFDRVTNITDGAGYQLQAGYALAGLNNKITNAMLGGQFLGAWQYDEYGRLTNNLDRNNVTTAMGYDLLNRMVTRQNFGTDGLHTGQELFKYGPLGLTNYIDQLNHLAVFVWDGGGRMLYQTNANNEVQQFTYNPANELLTLTDGKNQTTSWGYDEYGRVTNKLDANALQVLKYQYDPLSRLTNRWSVAKGSTTYRYDPLGNLTNVDYSAGTVSTPSIYYQYDGINRLINMVDGIGATAFGWTDGDQLSSENGPWANDMVSYSYSDRMRTSLTLLQPNASPWVQGYGYDSMMRLGNITSPAGGTLTVPSGTFTYSYSGGGDRVQQVQFPAFPSSSSLYIQNSYDTLARMTNTLLYSSVAGTVDLHGYAYDLGSEVTQQGFTTGNTTSYTYDNIGQLKTASGKGPGGIISRMQEQLGYGYDPAWNLNKQTNNTLVRTFVVNDLNELVTVTNFGFIPTVSGSTTSPATNVTVNGLAAILYGDSTFAVTNLTLTTGLNTLTALAQDTNGRVSSSSIQVNLSSGGIYTYDSNGNLTSDGTRNFAYDDENELVSAWVTNIWREDFAYDGLQRRRVTTEYTGSGGSWLQTNQVYYVYDGNLVFQERDQNYQPLTTYTRGLDLSGSLQGAGGVGGLLARSDKEQVVPKLAILNNPHPQYVISSYYHSDGNGNITALIEPNGLITASYEYDPYGNLLSMSGTIADANKYRFSSKEWNKNSGLYYYGYRFYDPNLQRWLNRDPIQEWGGINLYDFIFNDPMNLFDALGNCPPNDANPSTSNNDSNSGTSGSAESPEVSKAMNAGLDAAGWSDAVNAADKGLAAKKAYDDDATNGDQSDLANHYSPENGSTNVANALKAGSAVAAATVKSATSIAGKCLIESSNVRKALGHALSKLINSANSSQPKPPKAPNPAPPSPAPPSPADPPITHSLVISGTQVQQIPWRAP